MTPASCAVARRKRDPEFDAAKAERRGLFAEKQLWGSTKIVVGPEPQLCTASEKKKEGEKVEI